MTGEVIKSFLVGLGFDVDDASLSKFNQAIASATLKVSALYASIKITAAAIGFGISKISESFEQLGYDYKIIAPAINKALILRRELIKAYSAAGINIAKTVQESVRFNISLTKTKFALEAIYKSVASRFFGVLTRQSEAFRKRLYENMPKIQAALERVIQFIFRAFEATVELGSRLGSILSRVYQFFVELDKATDGWSTRLIAAVAAWKLLNLGFLATPLGMLIGGFTALLALWDDFKTFREGGISLINWGSDMTRTIVGMTAAILGLTGAILGAATAWNLLTNAGRIYAGIQAIINAVMLANPLGLLIAGMTALIGLITFLDVKWKLFGGTVSGFFSGLGDKVMNFLGGVSAANAAAAGKTPAQNLAQNISALNTNTGAPAAAPVGSNVTNNQGVNQSVHQETNINVTGVANAQDVGKRVSTEQNYVNFDLVRNLKGAVR